jgi:hypothetical protein
VHGGRADAAPVEARAGAPLEAPVDVAADAPVAAPVSAAVDEREYLRLRKDGEQLIEHQLGAAARHQPVVHDGHARVFQ